MKLSSKILSFVAAVAIVWVIISFFDVNFHNVPFHDGYEDYASWNMFAIIEGVS